MNPTKNTISWKVDEILKAAGGKPMGEAALRLVEEGREFYGVSIDSRRVEPDNIFVAIEGERFDAHDFIDEVVKKGVSCLILSGPKAQKLSLEAFDKRDVALIAVKDTKKALGDLAFYNRQRSNISVVGITGSNGKTTTRKMTAAVVRKRFMTLSTVGNLNNDIGLPLTLLSLHPKHEWAVLELGTNHPGEIDYLARICRPNMAVVTNVGPAHLEGLGSLEGVTAAKSEILNYLSSDDTAILNADDLRVLTMAEKVPGKVLFYGTDEKAEVRAEDIEESENRTRFRLAMDGQSVSITLNVSGKFMVINALAAAAVGFNLGLPPDEIAQALEKDFKPAGGRMNIFQTLSGVHVIDDTYNANPGSMAAALVTLKGLKSGGRSIFVAGDMLELGGQSAALHEQIGELAAGSGVERLYAAGPFSVNVAEGARKMGMNPDKILVGSKDEILADLLARLRPGDWVLVKGSRGMSMETIVEGLKQAKI